jgi:hypothetical protein
MSESKIYNSPYFANMHWKNYSRQGAVSKIVRDGGANSSFSPFISLKLEHTPHVHGLSFFTPNTVLCVFASKPPVVEAHLWE